MAKLIRKKLANVFVLNDKIFPFLVSVTYFLLFLESVTYLGFLKNIFFVDSRFFMALSITSAVFAVTGRFFPTAASEDMLLKKIVFQLNMLITPVLLIFYGIMRLVDALKYRNYVFSTFHVQPSVFFNLVLFSLALFITYQFRSHFRLKRSLVNLTLVFLSLVTLIHSLSLTGDMIFSNLAFVSTHFGYNYDMKMEQKVGRQFYLLTRFVNNIVPPGSNLLIPPQAFPWAQSGNGAFMRYFVHPVNLMNGEEKSSGEEVGWEDIDYVLLVWGEMERVEEPYTYGWPKFDVPAEKTIFMGSDGSVEREVAGDFIYKDHLGKNEWGLIKVKH